MKKRFHLGQKVIVNTGGKDTIAHIDNRIKSIHGFYWEEQDCYMCRFTEDSKKLLFNGAKVLEGHLVNDGVHYVHKNGQYIPADSIREYLAPSTPVDEVKDKHTALISQAPAMREALISCYRCLTMDSDMEEDFAPEIKEIVTILDKIGW